MTSEQLTLAIGLCFEFARWRRSLKRSETGLDSESWRLRPNGPLGLDGRCEGWPKMAAPRVWNNVNAHVSPGADQRVFCVILRHYEVYSISISRARS